MVLFNILIFIELMVCTDKQGFVRQYSPASQILIYEAMLLSFTNIDISRSFASEVQLYAEDVKHFLSLARYRQNHKWVTHQIRSGWSGGGKHRELLVLEKLSASCQLSEQEKHRKLLILEKLSAFCQLSEQEKHRKLLIQVNLSACFREMSIGNYWFWRNYLLPAS